VSRAAAKVRPFEQLNTAQHIAAHVAVCLIVTENYTLVELRDGRVHFSVPTVTNQQVDGIIEAPLGSKVLKVQEIVQVMGAF
jgi:hypothetical protein